MNNLTVKQRKFIEAYLISGNASKSAVEAGYSPKCARAIGRENLTKPDISNEIDRRVVPDKLLEIKEEIEWEIAARME